MVDEPDLDSAVFCRVVKDVRPRDRDQEEWDIRGRSREEEEEEEEVVVIPGTGARFSLRKGDVYVVRYSAVRKYVLGGQVELI